ncbi:uncharacterized protein F4812DRAFT_371073 [Daldinia caldariorum]|uniref:uncharacterized protein n=1 Tax=Daldinia caldariorum TaxID=326644 RepID=UPI002008E7EE|nr:uncharacterized protein F4812DRAFT_371073 [Daldinia caldariorum]KAI1468498.1 hypothetical protein F4812DRAFT_371073 [Daldinia caldariorum]
MATSRYSPDLLPRRESSPRPKNVSAAERRRPRLLRACATEPSITTSNACKGLLTSPNNTGSRRATDLLNRVAVVCTSSTSSNANASSSPPSSARSSFTLDAAPGNGRLSDSARDPHSVCYFSFPSFDAWEVSEHPDEEKMERSA